MMAAKPSTTNAAKAISPLEALESPLGEGGAKSNPALTGMAGRTGLSGLTGLAGLSAMESLAYDAQTGAALHAGNVWVVTFSRFGKSSSRTVAPHAPPLLNTPSKWARLCS